MPTARRDRYEWENVLASIELLRDDPDDDWGLRRIERDALHAIETKIQTALNSYPHEGEWMRIPVILTENERTIVNHHLITLTMVRVPFQLERLDLLGLHATDDEYAEIQDRVLYITTNSRKSSDEILFIWVAHSEVEWLNNWVAGCTTPDGDLR